VSVALDPKRGVGVMVHHEYVPGEKVLPPPDKVRKLRSGGQPAAPAPGSQVLDERRRSSASLGTPEVRDQALTAHVLLRPTCF
jgi:hypothetical protein